VLEPFSPHTLRMVSFLFFRDRRIDADKLYNYFSSFERAIENGLFSMFLCILRGVLGNIFDPSFSDDHTLNTSFSSSTLTQVSLQAFDSRYSLFNRSNGRLPRPSPQMIMR
jgi:hypothetical protein